MSRVRRLRQPGCSYEVGCGCIPYGDFEVSDIREWEYSIYSVYVDVYKKVIEKQTGKPAT